MALSRGRFHSPDLNDVDEAHTAQGLGCVGRRVSDPVDLRDALAWALIVEAPAVLDAVTGVHETALTEVAESASTRATWRLGLPGRPKPDPR